MNAPLAKAEPLSITVIGCGAIGGVIAAELARQRLPVSICSTNEEVRRVWATTGPYIKDRLVTHPLPGARIVETAQGLRQPADLVFVAVPPPQIDQVAASLQGRLSPQGRVVCLSNGWCEPRLAQTLGPDRVIGAVVTWGARMPEPGHYLRTSSGGFTVGLLDGTWSTRADQACELLKHLGPVRRTENLKGARMSKLIINCAVSGLGTVGGAMLGELLVQRDVRRIGIELISEAIRVAQADGTHLESIVGIDWDRWSSARTQASRFARHALLLAVGARYRKLRSSILASIERGRTPSIDYINGEIVALGRSQNEPTPYNQAVVDVVWAISRGELMAGPEALAEVQRRAESAAPYPDPVINP